MVGEARKIRRQIPGSKPQASRLKSITGKCGYLAKLLGQTRTSNVAILVGFGELNFRGAIALHTA